MLRRHGDVASAALRGKGDEVRKANPEGAKALRNGGGMTTVCMKMLRGLVDRWRRW